MVAVCKVFALFLIIGLFSVLSGCCGGSSTTVEKQPVVIQGPAGSSPTVGQELESLEDAYKKGIITKSQYEETKKKLLQKVGK